MSVMDKRHVIGWNTIEELLGYIKPYSTKVSTMRGVSYTLMEA
jgi:hypothetical protein